MVTLNNSSNAVVAQFETKPVYDANSRHWMVGTLSVYDPDKTLHVVDLDAPPASATRHITRLAFRNRFTQAEKIALELAALDNPSGTPEQRQQAAAIRVSLADTAAATFIDLDRPDTRSGVVMLETAGLLAASRATAILDAAVLDSERTATIS